MNKKISLGMALSMVLVAITATFLTTVLLTKARFNSKLTQLSNRSAMFQKLYEVDSRVRTSELFLDDIDQTTLTDRMIAGYVSGLGDTYAAYYSKEEYQKILDSDNGDGEGIGITLDTREDELKVMSVVNGSPAKTAGIKAEDKITSVNGKKVSTIGVEKAYSVLKGEEGKRLTLILERAGQELTVSLEISDYEIISVTEEIYGDVGIVKITEFNGSTPEQFTEAMERLKEQKINSYIFDLRNNPGGMLDSVCQILDELCPSGTLVTAKYLNGEEKTLYTSDANDTSGKMIVLVNENSASGAELFAAVMRDYEKATIVGTTTFGKGVAQSTSRLSDGSALKLTTFYYNPPKTENFNGVGVVPDVVAPMTDNTVNLDTLALEDDEQLQSALKVLGQEEKSD